MNANGEFLVFRWLA